MTPPTPNNMPGAGDPTPAEPQPAPEDVKPQPAPEPKPKTAKTEPPWGSDDDFNPAKAWKLVQNLRAENAKIKADAEPIRAEWESLRRASQTETDNLREDLTAASGREQLWRQQAVRAEAKALAAGRFSNADHAVALIGDLSELIEGDRIDTAALRSRFDALAAENPYLLAAQPPQGLTPNRGQGQSGHGQQPLEAQIKAAQDRGDVMASIALKQQQFYSKQPR